MGRTVLIADDYALLRRGVAEVLADAYPEWNYFESATFSEVLDVLENAKVDLLCIDVYMRGMRGAESIQYIRQNYPNLAILVVSALDDKSVIVGCLAAGANGYLLKGDRVEQVLKAVEQVGAGEVYVTPAFLKTSAYRAVMTPPAIHRDALAGFTPRQQEVVRQLATGCSTKEIARALDMGLGTVKVHLASIYRQLGARSRMQAVLLASKLIGTKPGEDLEASPSAVDDYPEIVTRHRQIAA